VNRSPHHFLDGRFPDQITLLQNRHPVSHPYKRGRVVRNHRDRHVVTGLGVFQTSEHFGTAVCVESRCRLVSDQQGGLAYQRLTDRNPLLLTSAQLMRVGGIDWPVLRQANLPEFFLSHVPPSLPIPVAVGARHLTDLVANTHDRI
jgi:hypothetical protein